MPQNSPRPNVSHRCRKGASPMTNYPIRTEPNPDLVLTESNYPRWETPDLRRAGWHSFSEIVRYGLTIRAPEVRALEKRIDHRIARLDRVRMLTAGSAF